MPWRLAGCAGEPAFEAQTARPVQSALDLLRDIGVEITATNQGIRVARNGARLKPVAVTTAPFPGFPTDLQAQLMALMTRANGTSRITETIFENRFMHVQELARLGARIHLDGETATIEGVDRLKGAQVMATDLRASVSLVIAALAAEGDTIVNRVYHLDRGFERLEDKLGRCGATVERISGSTLRGHPAVPQRSVGRLAPGLRRLQPAMGDALLCRRRVRGRP
jgi:UDP-N-acetylglucosamine 1-carboxyvinyltransferase